jgi:hypothetical protein
LDRKLARELKALADPTTDPYDTVSGKTMCTYDFYEGQGRLDGAFCEFTEKDKMEYLEKLRDFGVVNIEMEGKRNEFFHSFRLIANPLQPQSSPLSPTTLGSKLRFVA